MLAQTPPMGWNSWNTFGEKINEKLIFEMADFMVKEGYRDAGYEYLVIDDCWSLKQRNENGRLQADPAKFPRGIKAVADYVHSKGLKFGIYSCAGVRTCAGYPSSYDHEYVDAQTFADWGVDFLKYDYCNFPASGSGRQRYLTMSMALKATRRDILFSACNWGSDEPWTWMRSVGAHMYRSTGDIMDNFRSFTDIAKSQLNNLGMSASGCFNDMDMLTVGMFGKGNVALGRACTYEEYRLQFSLWCLFGVPLMMGADLRSVTPEIAALMKNPALLALDQDEECRPPYPVHRGNVTYQRENPQPGEMPWAFAEDSAYALLRPLSGGEFALGLFNFSQYENEIACILADAGVPVGSGYGLRLTDLFTGEDAGVASDSFHPRVPAHDCRLYRARLEKLHG